MSLLFIKYFFVRQTYEKIVVFFLKCSIIKLSKKEKHNRSSPNEKGVANLGEDVGLTPTTTTPTNLDVTRLARPQCERGVCKKPDVYLEDNCEKSFIRIS